MPIYEYRCNDCGHKAERLESAEQPARHECPECGSEDTKKAFSPFAARVRCSARSAAGRRTSPCCNGSCDL